MVNQSNQSNQAMVNQGPTFTFYGIGQKMFKLEYLGIFIETRLFEDLFSVPSYDISAEIL